MGNGFAPVGGLPIDPVPLVYFAFDDLTSFGINTTEASGAAKRLTCGPYGTTNNTVFAVDGYTGPFGFVPLGQRIVKGIPQLPGKQGTEKGKQTSGNSRLRTDRFILMKYGPWVRNAGKRRPALQSNLAGRARPAAGRQERQKMPAA